MNACTHPKRTSFGTLLLCLLACVLPARGQDAPADSLAPPVPPPQDTLRVGLFEAIGRSLEESPEVAQRLAALDYAQARHAEARASRYLPRFSLQTTHSVAPGLKGIEPGDRESALYLNPDVENDWEDLRPFNAFIIEAGQPLWTWGELSGSIRAARYGEQVDAARVEEKALEVAFRTAELYYNVLLTQQLGRLTGEAEETLDRAEREVRRLLEEGDTTVSEADLFQVQISQQEFRRRVVELKQRGRTAASGLSRQLFAPAGTAALPATALLEPVEFEMRPLEEYVELALQHRPELRQARAGVAARKALVEVEASEYYPKLIIGGRFGGRYAHGRPSQESAYIGEPFIGGTSEAGFRIEQNLNFFQTRARVEQAEAELNEVRAQRAAARQLVPFEVEEAWRNVVSAKGALQARDRAFTLAKEWERLEQTNYDLGFGSTDDLTSALQSRLQLQIAYYEAVRDYNVAVMRLLRVIGLLNEPEQVGTLVDLPSTPAPDAE